MNSYSQHGEDLFIMSYISSNNLNIPKLVVEAGALDGKTNSNSLSFIEQGWRGIVIEPNPVSYEKLYRLHKHNSTVATKQAAIVDTPYDKTVNLEVNLKMPGHTKVVEHETEVKVLGYSLTSLVNTTAQYRVYGYRIGILSLDLEGGEDACFPDIIALQPCFLIIEANNEDARQRQVKALSKHYTELKRMNVNTIWIRKDIAV